MDDNLDNWDGRPARVLPVKLSFASGGFLVDLCVVWPFIFCAFSFSLYFAIHPNSRDKVYGYRQIPTLSQTGMLVPESLFFTYGLHVEGALLAVLFTFLYAHFKNKISAIEAKISRPLLEGNNHVEEDALVEGSASPDAPTQTSCYNGLYFFCCCCCMSRQSRKVDVPFLNFWNRGLWYLGLICSLLMTLVGTVNLSVHTDLHGGLAFFMYFTAIMHMIFYYFTMADAMGYTPTQIIIHRACLFVCLPFNIFMFVMILIMYNTCNNDPCMESAVDLIVTLEYTTTLALLAYVYRFRNDLQDINLVALSKVLVEKEVAVENMDNVVNSYSPPSERDRGYEGDSIENNQRNAKHNARADSGRDHPHAIVDLMI